MSDQNEGATYSLIGGPFDGDTIYISGERPTSFPLVEEESGRIATYEFDEQRSALKFVGYQEEAGKPLKP